MGTETPGRTKWQAALGCALLTTIYAAATFEGQARNYRLWYYVPAAALAGAFIANRIAERPHGKPRWIIDAVVAILCLSRPLTGQPPVSGHAWFCIHALLTCRDPLARILAIAVTALTCYAKIVLWHWDPTLWPGLAAGVISGLAWRSCAKAPGG